MNQNTTDNLLILVLVSIICLTIIISVFLVVYTKPYNLSGSAKCNLDNFDFNFNSSFDTSKTVSIGDVHIYDLIPKSLEFNDISGLNCEYTFSADIPLKLIIMALGDSK